ncbi:CHAT domain-containing protein [Streptomyces sp. NPDC048256]|uniref:CHAT domain-containing protein n=1 Tax=unclassified Streptomyces TaxID=2593676 RepID=UPI00324E28A6
MNRPPLPPADAPAPPPVCVLMLSAVGTQRGGPDTGREQREVAQVIQVVRYREALALQTAPAVQGEDILPLLLAHDPTVLHFSGHAANDGLRVLTADGGDAPLDTDGLGELLAAAAKGIRLAVLNACYTEAAADKLAQITGCAIGYPERVDDQTTIAFARSLYHCVGTGMSVGAAHRAAVASLWTFGTPEHLRPRLKSRPDVEPEACFLLNAAHQVPATRPGALPDPTALTARQAGSAKKFTALITGTAASEATLRAGLASTFDGMEVEWMRFDDTDNTMQSPGREGT